MRAVEDAVAGSSLAVAAVVVPERDAHGDCESEEVSTFASPDFEELFGYSVHELRGRAGILGFSPPPKKKRH